MIVGTGTKGLSLRAVFAASMIIPTLFVVGGAWIHYETMMSATLESARQEVDVLSAQAAQVFETVDLVAMRVGDHIRGMSWTEIADSAALRGEINNLKSRYPQVAAIWLFDDAGSLRVPADPSFGDVRLSQLAGLPEGGSSIVVRHSDRGVEFGVAHHTNTDTGGAGHIVVMISPRYFTEIWKDAGADNVSLLEPSGLVLARSPSHPTDDPELNSNSALARAIGESERGVIETTSLVERTGHVDAFRKLPGRPVLIAYRADEQPALQRWRMDVTAYGVLGVLSAVAMTLIGLTVGRRTRGQQLAWSRAMTREVEQRAAVELELQEAQKMEVVGQLAGGLAHDFGNVLAGITMHLAALRRHESTSWERDRIIQEALIGISQGNKVVRSLLDLARRQPPKTEDINVNDRLRAIEGLLRQCLKPMSNIELDLEPALWAVKVDAHSIELAILNLIINARDAMPSGGTVRIRTRCLHLEGGPPGLSGDHVAVEVSDTGTGMEPQVVARASEPFFTTKPIGEGTGLGLSQVFHFAEHSGGAATIASQPGIGTIVTIYLPRSRLPNFSTSMLTANDSRRVWQVRRDEAATKKREASPAETPARSDSRATS
jgi:two-component system NtrC family sensor kinase